MVLFVVKLLVIKIFVVSLCRDRGIELLEQSNYTLNFKQNIR